MASVGGIYEKRIDGGFVVYEIKQVATPGKVRHNRMTVTLNVEVLAVYPDREWWQSGGRPPEYDAQETHDDS